jgi:hypothetical protein
LSGAWGGNAFTAGGGTERTSSPGTSSGRHSVATFLLLASFLDLASNNLLVHQQADSSGPQFETGRFVIQYEIGILPSHHHDASDFETSAAIFSAALLGAVLAAFFAVADRTTP